MRRLLFACLLALWPVAAHADQLVEDTIVGERVEGPVFANWAPCWFIATSTDVGLLYLRPRISFGYGKPHTTWAGIDLNPTLSLSGPGGYGGIRLASPNLDLRVGSRASFAIHHAALQPQDSYTQDDISLRLDGRGGRSSYLSSEAELTFKIPAGPGAVIGEVAGTYIMLHPEGRFLFEERLKVVVDPPWLGKVRLGYRFPVLIKGVEVGIHPSSELLVANNRPEPTVRAGLLADVPLGPRLSVRANFMHTVQSPDEIFFTGSNLGEITLRWRTAWSLSY